MRFRYYRCELVCCLLIEGGYAYLGKCGVPEFVLFEWVDIDVVEKGHSLIRGMIAAGEWETFAPVAVLEVPSVRPNVLNRFNTANANWEMKQLVSVVQVVLIKNFLPITFSSTIVLVVFP